MSLRRSSVFLICFFSPPSPPSPLPSPGCLPRQLEEVDGPLCPAPGYVLFFRASSTSQSDTPPHSAHFSPPLCQCTTDVDGESSGGRSGLRGFANDSWTRERETGAGFDFISRMNMQPRDSHRRNYHAVSAASLHYE